MIFNANCLNLLLFFSILCEGKELIFKYDGDITNPENWEGGKLEVGCKGVHFAPVNSAPVFIERLTAAEMTLPRDGEIFLGNNGFIEFKDNKKCINLKPIDSHSWYDPSSWRLATENIAIPYKQRLPCKDDTVNFPKPFYTHVKEENFWVTVGGLITEGKKFLVTRGTYSFGTHPNSVNVRVVPTTCEDPYGCLCHNEEIIFCPSRDKSSDEKLPCLSPIFPEDSCKDMCGAYVTYKIGKGPDLENVRNKLKEYEVVTYASRVIEYLGNEVIQVIFTEKEYSGTSLEAAKDFQEFLNSEYAENVEIFESGALYMEGKSSFGIIFGSFIAVVVFFGILLYTNGNTSISVIISRFNTRGRGSIFATPFFARFDNIDENSIIDGSESGSILDIAKSFDNPMYGQSSSESEEQKPKIVTKIIESHKAFDNPIFGKIEEEAEETFDEPMLGQKSFDNPLFGQDVSREKENPLEMSKELEE